MPGSVYLMESVDSVSGNTPCVSIGEAVVSAMSVAFTASSVVVGAAASSAFLELQAEKDKMPTAAINVKIVRMMC
jgi:hypothetical protein